MAPRYALLIESSQVRGENDLPGARADIVLMSEWLLSSKGGAWREDEIHFASHPSGAELEAAFSDARESNYAFVAFSGHGYFYKDGVKSQTRVILQEDEHLAARYLNPGCRRCTIVVDACRNIVVPVRRTLTENLRTKAARFARRADREMAREKFDWLVENADPGAVFLYSCAIDESAGEDENGQGGIFTLGLYRSATEWEPSKPGVFLSVENVFDRAARFTSAEMPQQHPRAFYGRRRKHFPFAVWT